MWRLTKQWYTIVLCAAIAGATSFAQVLSSKGILQRSHSLIRDTSEQMHMPLGNPQASVSSNDSLALDGEHCQGQTSPEVNYGRLAIVGGAWTATIISIHIYQQNGWWKDNRTSFHFREDLKYGLSVDKIGHFYSATVATFIGRKSIEWAEIPEQKALLLGVGVGLLFQTYVEIEDGFSAWGFDRVDFATNVIGAAWPIAQYYIPFFQNFDFKFSYHPSPLLNNPGGSGFQGQQHLIFDDYEGQTMWLSTKVKNFLPAALEQYWPEFLCLAVGYGARDIAGPEPYPVYYLALDYDMTKIIPAKTWFLKTLGEALNFIHFPAPAVRISPSAIWYGFYF